MRYSTYIFHHVFSREARESCVEVQPLREVQCFLLRSLNSAIALPTRTQNIVNGLCDIYIEENRDMPDPDTGIRYPVKFRHPALSSIRYKFAGYLPDSTVRYFVTTMKRKSLLVKHEQLLSVRSINDEITTYFFRDGDVNCSLANSSEFYILNTSKQCKVNHKIWPW
jgi:hypothetical protein